MEHKSDKYMGKYRSATARLQTWDYGWNAPYFVTLCTHDRQCFFGSVANHQMILSPMGQLAHQIWMEIPVHFPFVRLGAFVVMPNHVHGIIIIDKPEGDGNREGDGNGEGNGEANGTDAINRVPTKIPIPTKISIPTEIPISTIIPIPTAGGITGPHNPMLHDNLSRIIRWYKGRTSFECRKPHTPFAWQSRFHDHIIRDDRSFETIWNYIVNNPHNWGDDKFHGNS